MRGEGRGEGACKRNVSRIAIFSGTTYYKNNSPFYNCTLNNVRYIRIDYEYIFSP